MTEMTETARAMPTEADVPEIRAITEAYSGESMITGVTATSGGVLVSFYGPSPRPALEAVGYSVEGLREGLVLMTGTVDLLARLDAQIAALTAERDRLTAEV